MKLLKSASVLLLVLSMLMGMMSFGAAETALTPMADAGDPISFDIFIRDPSVAPAKDNAVIQKIQELSGVTLNFEFLVGDLAQKQGVMLAGEDYPDALFAEAAKFIDAGAFIPLEGYLTSGQYPNLQKHYAKVLESMKAEDGHIYVLELYDVMQQPHQIMEDTGVGFFIQKAVLEDAGYVIPKTLDEYFILIENYMEKYPEIDGVKTIGFEVLCDGWRDFCLRNPAQHLMGAGNDGDVFVDRETFEPSLYQISDTAKAYYKKLNDEYHKGVIQAETFTQSYDQYLSRLSSGAVLGMFDQGWNFNQAVDVLKTDGKDNRTYVAVPLANEGVRDSYLDGKDPDNMTVTGINGIGITKNCKNPERLLAFYDWLLNEDVQAYLIWGEEGTDYVFEEGRRILTPERRQLWKDTAKKRDLTGHTLWNYSPKLQGLAPDGNAYDPGNQPEEFKAGLTEYNQKFLDGYGFDYFAQLLSEPEVRPTYYPVWGFTIEDGSAASVASTKMVETCRKYMPRLVLCEPAEYDALWAEFVSEIEKGNPQPYLDEVSRQIKLKMGL